MGRKAGVTADETRAALLDAAARVFASKGYDGASIADITNEAGLSSGAIYAHYDSKAELFFAVVKEHGRREFVALFGAEAQAGDFADFLRLVGSSYDRRRPSDAALMIEAIVASKRHPEVEELLSTWLGDAEARLAAGIRAAQAQGVLDPAMSAAAAGRFLMMVSLGARITASLSSSPVDHADWAELIERVVGAGLASPEIPSAP
jgi:AcrR family transcriptional regulator